MIPLLLLAGALLARWWWQTTLAAALIWPLVLLGADVVDRPAEVALGSFAAALNVASAAAIVNGFRKIINEHKER